MSSTLTAAAAHRIKNHHRVISQLLPTSFAFTYLIIKLGFSCAQCLHGPERDLTEESEHTARRPAPDASRPRRVLAPLSVSLPLVRGREPSLRFPCLFNSARSLPGPSDLGLLPSIGEVANAAAWSPRAREIGRGFRCSAVETVPRRYGHACRAGRPAFAQRACRSKDMSGHLVFFS
jgi:hypothetical protein